jgi:hypothetical protein
MISYRFVVYSGFIKSLRISICIFLLAILSGCIRHNDLKNAAPITAVQSSLQRTAKQTDCHENTCVQVQMLSHDVLRTIQRENIKKLHTLYDTNNGLVGSSRLLKRYAVDGVVSGSLQSATLDFIVTIETDSTGMRGRQYFEVAQELESSMQEQVFLTIEENRKLIPSIVRLYEVYPLQYSWKFLLTFVHSNIKPTSYVFHWNDTILKSGGYAISL